MEMSEKIKICSTCNNRKMDIQRGIICNLTDAKPEFEFACESYSADEAAVAREKAKAEDQSLEVFGDNEVNEVLKGANWFRTIASLSLINVVVSFFGIAFIFGLGTTQLLQAAITNDMINPILGGLCILILPAFFFWTWWLSAAKGYKLAYNIGWLIYLLDSLLLIYLFIQNNDASSLIIDFVLHIIVLLGCFKIFDINAHNSKANKFSFGIHKIGYLIATALTIAVSIYSVLCITELFSPNKENMSAVIKTLNEELPRDIDENVVFQRIVDNGESIEYVYQLKGVYLSESDADYLSEYARVHKHEMLYNMSIDPNADKFVSTCLEEGFDFTFCFNDAISEKLYDVTITHEEYKSLKVDGTYYCPMNELSDLINKYTAELPIEYLGGMILNNISLSSDNTTIIYDVKLPQMTSDEFSSVTPSYLNEYIKTNLADISDSIMRLAVINQMTICFDVSTNSGIKYTKVNITPEFYNSSSN